MLKIIRYFLSKIAVNTMVSLFHQACFVFQIYFDISSKVVNDNLQTETSAKLIVQSLLISSYFCTFIV